MPKSKVHPVPYAIVPFDDCDKSILIRCGSYPAIIAVDNDDVPEGAGEATAKFVVQACNQHAVLAEAVKTFYEFYFDDLGKNNKGFMGRLFLNDYQKMNDAYVAMEKAMKLLKT